MTLKLRSHGEQSEAIWWYQVRYQVSICTITAVRAAPRKNIINIELTKSDIRDGSQKGTLTASTRIRALFVN
jgi:hypothetical protein